IKIPGSANNGKPGGNGKPRSLWLAVRDQLSRAAKLCSEDPIQAIAWFASLSSLVDLVPALPPKFARHLRYVALGVAGHLMDSGDVVKGLFAALAHLWYKVMGSAEAWAYSNPSYPEVM